MALNFADLTEDQVRELSDRLQAIHTADADLANAVQAVSVKVPTFWTARPEVWFIQLEAQFASKNITAEETRQVHRRGNLRFPDQPAGSGQIHGT